MLLTHLLHKVGFPKEEITELYFRPWAVEDHSRNRKVVPEIEKFHGMPPDGIRRELFAAVIVSVVAGTLLVVTSKIGGP